MSKPDPTGAKSLEEILASIRKSLAEETSERPTEARIAPAQAVQGQTKMPTPANVAAKDSGPLPGKPAGALNGSASAPALDKDLSELLAPATRMPAPSASAETAKPSQTGNGEAKDKDPLWFLSRLSAAAGGGAAQPGSAARARDAAKAPPSEEEVKLSRPETLRKSLPPLFSAGAAPAPAPETAADAASPTERTQPRVLRPQTGGETGTVGAGRETVAEATTYLAPAPRSEAKAAPGDLPRPVFADPAAVAAVPVNGAASTPAPLPEVSAGAVPERVFGPAAAAALPGPLPTGAPPSRALEQVVAELLEPVIRQWLHSNLPRLIETAVREEVARAIAAERGAPKG